VLGRDLVWAQNTKESLAWKIKNFGEHIYTRFPPEPNAYLHIGHCKAMRFSFKVAELCQGFCYLRYDDTNPDKENLEYINSIK